MAAPDRSYMFECLERLVAINTENPPGRELEGASFLRERLSELGFTTELHEVYPGRANIIATFDNGDGPVFAFNSHIDVVPAGDGWTNSPFKLVERNGRLYGRGACDAKGPIVAMIEAARMLKAQRDQWRGKLMLVFVFDEETQSLGAKAFAKSHPKVDYAMIGEPTTNQIATAHKGCLRVIVRVKGIPAHSGTPDLGTNAIFRAARLLGMLEQHHIEELSCNHHHLVGHSSLTVTRIEAGLADNIVPDSCTFMIDRRMIPGEKRETAVGQLEQIFRRAHDEFGVDAVIHEYRPTTGPATETPLDHPIVKVSQRSAAPFNSNAAPRGFPGGCDLVHFSSIGANGVIVGPGDLAVAHKPDEYVPVDQFINAPIIYRDTLLGILGSQQITLRP
ncbi:MAG TPA: M20 family metallopeptidase [Terriglobales bacterium]|nr:M20 family metallopeptidase [Terriglobales bacterium]